MSDNMIARYIDDGLKQMGFKYVQHLEYQFARPRKWRADIAYPEIKVMIEIEGGVWTQGRHTRGVGFKRDMEKYNEAAIRGWLLLRFTPTEALTNEALYTILRAVQTRHAQRKGD